MIEYKVRAGDCLSSIAKQYGFKWQTLWDFGPNAQLKSKRKDPNILMPGDIVRIPPTGDKQESKAVDQHHRFKRKAEQAVLKLRVLVDSEPIKNEPCLLVYHVSGKETIKSGKTDGDGNVEIDGSKEIKMPGDTRDAILRVGSPPAQLLYTLAIGKLAPSDQLLGVQQRLNNLGYRAGPEDGQFGPRTKEAVRWFQQAHDLQQDGIPGPQVQNKLREIHGC